MLVTEQQIDSRESSAPHDENWVQEDAFKIQEHSGWAFVIIGQIVPLEVMV